MPSTFSRFIREWLLIEFAQAHQQTGPWNACLEHEEHGIWPETDQRLIEWRISVAERSCACQNSVREQEREEILLSAILVVKMHQFVRIDGPINHDFNIMQSLFSWYRLTDWLTVLVHRHARTTDSSTLSCLQRIEPVRTWRYAGFVSPESNIVWVGSVRDCIQSAQVLE